MRRRAFVGAHRPRAGHNLSVRLPPAVRQTRRECVFSTNLEIDSLTGCCPLSTLFPDLETGGADNASCAVALNDAGGAWHVVRLDLPPGDPVHLRREVTRKRTWLLNRGKPGLRTALAEASVGE
ncbi:Glycine Receptor Subunit Beta [Manis pentadactyla]|nr:Glycine Receptor Subunit Beta [Manis pentadactyla]